ncbi:DUF4231 domain-containing protein [Neorhizobium sp. JUb45]|uniref:DUF4231 domain-containing protein n=1 Tax=Neorhizobium sp. JUb45 TaxID=2485113 RepID=UPI001404528E|nr:DUF4231 domain-containing protein [Neorhizobium sp. JUb45]
MKIASRIIITVISFASVLITLIITAAIITWTLSILIPEQLGSRLAEDALRSLGLSYTRYRGPSDADSGVMNHEKAVARILTCRKITNEKQLEESDKRILRPSIRNEEINISYAIIDLNTSERRISFMSAEIVQKRYEFQNENDRNYKYMQYSTFATIIIGMLTTAFISLSSSKIFKDESNISATVQILAILLPAIGTALAAVVAFYNPTEKYARAKQASTSLGQLHRDISTEIYKIDCINNLNDEKQRQLSTKIDGWESQYGNVLNIAAARDLTQQGNSSSGTGNRAEGH